MKEAETMQRDIRETALYREAEPLYKTLRQPGTGHISDAPDIHASSDGKQAVFAGTLVDELEGAPPTRVCLADVSTGDTRVLTFGHPPPGTTMKVLGNELDFRSVLTVAVSTAQLGLAQTREVANRCASLNRN